MLPPSFAPAILALAGLLTCRRADTTLLDFDRRPFNWLALVRPIRVIMGVTGLERDVVEPDLCGASTNAAPGRIEAQMAAAQAGVV